MLLRLRQAGTLGTAGAGLDLRSRPGPRPGNDARPASMARVIEWSWSLRSPVLQVLLCALTGFVSG